MRLIIFLIVIFSYVEFFLAINQLNSIARSLDGIHTELVNVHWELKEGQLVIPTK